MQKYNFLLEMLGAGDGTSSKRVVMVFFVLLFAFLVLWNLFTGQEPAPHWRTELFDLVRISMALVFGEKLITWFMALKGHKPPVEK
jgi:hypothetical protein